MRRDVFHHYEEDLQTVFEAYASALEKPPFKKKPYVEPFEMITFGIGYSFKFNMNGGSVHIHFAEKDGGTDVQVHFTILQLLGARYQAYDDLLTKAVEEELAQTRQSKNPSAESFFAKRASSSQPRFCGHCGAPIKEGNDFCTSCGRKVD
ncbi:MAG: zinc ribbon domain-containing protein [Bacilli bacterium]|nr:zinc ribbon domain-containing protein [Bacilli bacterium]